jgi:hypothetical protein
VVGYDWDPFPTPAAGRSEGAQLFTVDEVAHWSPIPDPNANFRGMSWLSPIIRETTSDGALTNYKTRYLEHGTPVVAVKYPQKLQPATVDAVIERVGAKYGGASNAWKTLIFDQGADPILGKGLQDLDFRAIQAGGEQRICAAAGVPPLALGLTSGQGGETYQQAMRRLGDATLRPLWRSGCAALQKLVTVPAGSRLWFDTSDIAALQAAETERAQVSQVHAAAILTLIQAGFIRESVIAAINGNDLSLLKPDPNAPTPGVTERETINVADMGPPVTGPESGTSSNTVNVLGVQGKPPGGGQVLTQPQTPASKKPMPSSIPRRPDGYPRPNNPSPNNGRP